MKRKWWIAGLVGLMLLCLLLRAPALLSRSLGNLGLVALSKALTANPEDPAPEALVEAEVWLRLALASSPENRGAHHGLGWVFLMHGGDQRAVAEWQRAGWAAYDFALQGEQARFASGFAKARWWYEQAAQLAPDVPEMWRVVGLTAQDLIRRGEQAFGAKQFAEAQWWYEQASQFAPDFAEEWRAAGLATVDLMMRGEQAYAAKRYTEARWWYTQANRLAPDLRDAWQAAGLAAEDLVERGKQAHGLGRWQVALWWYEQAKVLNSGLQSSVLYLQYLTLKDSGDTASALPVLQEAVSQDRGWLDADMRFHAWYLWGTWLYQQGRNADAEDAFSRALALPPQGRQLQREHSESYRLLGLLQEAQGKLEQAVQSLQMAVRLDEGNVWAHSHFGQVLYMHDSSRAPEVEREFSAALSLSPENIGLWKNLVRFWLRAGEKERAISLCSLAQDRGIVADLEEVCPAP